MAYVIDEQREEKEIQAKYDELLAACREIYRASPISFTLWPWRLSQ